LGGHVLGIGTYRDAAAHDHKSCLYMKKDAPAFALLKACSQINAEAANLAYSLNTFCFIGDNSVVAFTAVASTRGIQAIRVIRVLCDVELYSVPTGIWSQVSYFRGLEEIKIDYSGKKLDLDSTEDNQAWFRTLTRFLRSYKPGVRVMTWDSSVGLSSVEYH